MVGAKQSSMGRLPARLGRERGKPLPGDGAFLPGQAPGGESSSRKASVPYHRKQLASTYRLMQIG